MKKITLLSAFLMLNAFFIFSCKESTKSGNTNSEVIDTLDAADKIVPADTIPINELEFLKLYHDKYPDDVKLLDNPAFTKRLKKLLGERYVFLKETWAVEVPMEYKDDVFVASACQAHNCASTNFIVVYDFSKNRMYAGIREDDQVKSYSEDGSSSEKIREWMEK